MKTYELSKLSLDYAVILVLFPRAFENKPSVLRIVANYPYHNSWTLSGPILDKIVHEASRCYHPDHPIFWQVSTDKQYADGSYVCGYGPTLQIAALRCLVTAHLGDEVDIPLELI